MYFSCAEFDGNDKCEASVKAKPVIEELKLKAAVKTFAEVSVTHSEWYKNSEHKFRTDPRFAI